MLCHHHLLYTGRELCAEFDIFVNNTQRVNVRERGREKNCRFCLRILCAWLLRVVAVVVGCWMCEIYFASLIWDGLLFVGSWLWCLMTMTTPTPVLWNLRQNLPSHDTLLMVGHSVTIWISYVQFLSILTQSHSFLLLAISVRRGWKPVTKIIQKIPHRKFWPSD